jgi:hypothetical protein
MKVGFFNEADQWTADAAKINTPENLEAIRRVLEESGPIVVRHSFYRGANRPDHIAFDEFEEFEEYLNTKASAGDAIDVWNFADMGTAQNRFAFGKCPDDEGRVPKKGAY